MALLRSGAAPWDEAVPDALSGAGVPTTVVSGNHSPVFELACDAVARALHASRRHAPGAGHDLPRAPDFAALLEDVLGGASRAAH